MVLVNLFARQQWGRDLENRLMDIAKGEERVCGKSNMETYITICKTDSQQEFSVCLREIKEGLCINLEGWGVDVHGR